MPKAMPLSRESLRPLFDSIRQVETGGEANPAEAVGLAGELGPYQIMPAFWQDATQHCPELRCHYEDVKIQDYAEDIIFAYWLRWCPNAVYGNRYEELARVFHGGPRGMDRPHTVGYWKKVQGLMP